MARVVAVDGRAKSPTRRRTPTHVLASPGDRQSLCGVKDPLPHVADKFVERHVEGWGMIVCAECEERRLGNGV